MFHLKDRFIINSFELLFEYLKINLDCIQTRIKYPANNIIRIRIIQRTLTYTIVDTHLIRI